MARAVVTTALEVAGLGLIVTAGALTSVILGLILAGLALILVGIRLA